MRARSDAKAEVPFVECADSEPVAAADPARNRPLPGHSPRVPQTSQSGSMPKAPDDPIFEARAFKHAKRWYIISRWPDGHFEQVIDAHNGNDFKDKSEALSWIRNHSRAWIERRRG